MNIYAKRGCKVIYTGATDDQVHGEPWSIFPSSLISTSTQFSLKIKNNV